MSGEREQPLSSLDVVITDQGARPAGEPSGQPSVGPMGRPFIQVWFECAGLYQKVFRAVDGSGYAARCGRCGKTINFRVGPGGTAQRTFKVSC
jgi:hypothetical protein